MDRNQAKQLLPIVQAYAEGKNIQYNSVTSGWRDITESEGLPMGFLEEKPSYFRIKKEFIYRPFANAEECWQEMLKHQPFGWVKTDSGYEQVWHVNEDDDFNATFKYSTFADGLPFGVKVEE